VEKDNVTTFAVRVSIDNPTGEIRALMTANAEILIAEHRNVLAVPEQAVSYNAARQAFVQVPDAKARGGERQVSVTVGLSDGTHTEIDSGLRAGDRVVLPQS
jgi:HlyD family secretion protein